MPKVHKNLFVLSVLVLGAGFLISSVVITNASSETDIVFPVQELGGCQDEARCHAFCDKPENSRACLSFAKKHNLFPKEQIERWENFIDVASGEGPGGCTDEVSCTQYCENATHILECLTFVEKHDLVSPQELADMRKVAAALQAGAKLPNGCKNKAECLDTCENKPVYISECVEFAEKGGFISQEKAAEARKFAPLIERGETPGGCTRKDTCELYCAEPVHAGECLEFALKYDLIPPDEVEMARKVLPFMKRGETPGGCTNKKECESYCDDTANFIECVDFAERAEFVSKEEAEIARKVGGKGPGGCKSSRDCESFCSKSENQRDCIDFAKEHDLISQEELKYVDQLGDFHLCFENLDQEARSCFEEKLGKEALQKMIRGEIPFDPGIRRKAQDARACVKKTDNRLGEMPVEIRSCLEKKAGPDIFAKIETGNLSCKDISSIKPSIDVCVTEFKAKIIEKARACAAKSSCKEVISCAQALQAEAGAKEDEEGGLPPDVKGRITACVQELQKGDRGAGPGGCTSTKECVVYCQAHLQDKECLTYLTGGDDREFPGPGGCQTPQECEIYCRAAQDHPACGPYIGPKKPPRDVYQVSPVANACYKRLYGGDFAPSIVHPTRATSVAGCVLGILASIGPVNPDPPCNGDPALCIAATAAYCRDSPQVCETWIDQICRTGFEPGTEWRADCQKERKNNCPTAKGYGCGRLTPIRSHSQGYHTFSLEERVCVKKVYDQYAVPSVFVPPADWQQKIASCKEEYRVCAADYRSSKCRSLEAAFGFNSLSPEPEVPPEFQGSPETPSTPQAPTSAPSEQKSSEYFDYKQYCPQFESTPSCSYVGAPDSQSYKLCKQCFPNK